MLFVATIALIAVPLSINSGETLADTIGENALIEAHEEQSEQVLPFVIVLWLAALGLSRRPGSWVTAGTHPTKASVRDRDGTPA